MTVYYCCTLRRRVAVKEAGVLNGIEYVEVRDTEEPVTALRQRTLYVRLLAPAAGLDASNVAIDGGERIPTVEVEWAAPGDDLPPGEDGDLVAGLEDLDHLLVVRTAQRGDRSQYRLRLVAGGGLESPPPGFDPRLVEVGFSFAVECPSDFDCLQPCTCAPEEVADTDIDYLAKDYQGFRRIMLERMSQLAPGWTERNPADVGVALVELLAYTADELSYRQDAVATEAYLGTARSRVSLRRHARLVDYRVHDGCNARAWVQVEVSAPTTLAAGTTILTRVPDVSGRLAPDSDDHRRAMRAGPVVFETMTEVDLDPDLAELRFWTWGEQACCLPSGATRATLRGHHGLQVGSVLLLAETLSPTELTTADADPTRRWAVRLVEVSETLDPSGGLFEPSGSGSVDVTDIAWAEADALPFPLCLSAGDADVETARAWGNIVLADHGRSVVGEPLGVVPGPHLAFATSGNGGCDGADAPVPVPARFRPVLAQGPVTSSELLDPWAPASRTTSQDVRATLPALTLRTDPATDVWTPRPDLLNSDNDARHVVVETEHDGSASIRFGDGQHGAEPPRDAAFLADYRVGNGTEGNVGAQSLAHVVTPADGVLGCRNPLPAAGGRDAESADEVRRDAPHAFARQERAVTAEDYGEVAGRETDVQQAAATFRWTGSWRTVFLTADRPGGLAVDETFERSLRSRLERFRMAGYDLEVDAPQYVPLEIGLLVCVHPDHFRSDVRQAVLQVLGSGIRPDGERGLFHPDRFTFGQPVFLSSVYAAVHAVTGVESVTVTTFRRQQDPATSGLESGVLTMGRLEIAQLDNNPNFPDRGVLTLDLGGGA